MFATCWSAKGGSGTTVVAAALALVLAERDPLGAVLVDLAGDLPAALGLAEPSGPGLGEWLAAGSEVPVDGLERLEEPVTDSLRLISRGRGPLGPIERSEALAAALAGEDRSVVVDAGVPDWPAPAEGWPAPADGRSHPVDESAPGVLAAAAGHSLLVTRACYLSLRRAVAAPVRPSGVVLVTEADRSLRRVDVEQVVGVDVVAEVPIDPSVARAVDAGLLSARLPRALIRALGRAA